MRTAAAIATGIVVIAAVAAVCVFVWLGAYAPLEGLDSGFAPGPGIGAAVQPVTGSLGRPVYFPTLRRGRSFDTAVTLHNKGRFTVTVSGLDEPPPGATPWIGATALLATTSATPDVYADRVRLRYSYLSLFTRTQTVRLPFAVTLRCVGGPPATP